MRGRVDYPSALNLLKCIADLMLRTFEQAFHNSGDRTRIAKSITEMINTFSHWCSSLEKELRINATANSGKVFWTKVENLHLPIEEGRDPRFIVNGTGKFFYSNA